MDIFRRDLGGWVAGWLEGCRADLPPKIKSSASGFSCKTALMCLRPRGILKNLLTKEFHVSHRVTRGAVHLPHHLPLTCSDSVHLAIPKRILDSRNPERIRRLQQLMGQCRIGLEFIRYEKRTREVSLSNGARLPDHANSQLGGFKVEWRRATRNQRDVAHHEQCPCQFIHARWAIGNHHISMLC